MLFFLILLRLFISGKTLRPMEDNIEKILKVLLHCIKFCMIFDQIAVM